MPEMAHDWLNKSILFYSEPKKNVKTANNDSSKKNVKTAKTDSFNIFHEIFPHFSFFTFFAFFNISYHRLAFDNFRRSSAEPLRKNVKTVNVFRHQYQREMIKLRKMLFNNFREIFRILA